MLTANECEVTRDDRTRWDALPDLPQHPDFNVGNQLSLLLPVNILAPEDSPCGLPSKTKIQGLCILCRSQALAADAEPP